MQTSRTESTAIQTWHALRSELLDERTANGSWEGRLSSSALATATAISALAEYKTHSRNPCISEQRLTDLIARGAAWCLARQNEDGGWGDTDVSHSNIATTMLVVSAIRLSGLKSSRIAYAMECSDNYCRQVTGTTPTAENSIALVAALKQRYGADKTFAVPILANCAIAGLLPWKMVPSLPCEAALVPQSLFRFVNLPVVSYAIPALVAIGQAKFLAAPPWNPFAWLARRMSIRAGLRLLAKMQPGSGGFLEAIPLTSFVAMNLAHSGRADLPVTENCIRFIDESFRDEGNEGTWPIDTNLTTWNTTLAINALGTDSPDGDPSSKSHLNDELLEWLLGCQYKTVHPFTGAAPGGWGWSDLSGAVPDADDTPGALLALRAWWNLPELADDKRKQILLSARAGIRWLIDLQNRDKGWPTFCRGWGQLPFDRSGSDITAHVLRAMLAWQHDIGDPALEKRIAPAAARGFQFIERTQNADGSWSPLWFGNHDRADEDNPLYGTAKVLFAWRDATRANSDSAQRGLVYLLAQQNADGGWGGGPSRSVSVPNFPANADLPRTSSLQETALVCEVLASIPAPAGRQSECMAARQRGKSWLIDAVKRKEQHETWPIGFYFAKLWYYEKLYPLVFVTSAFRHLVALDADDGQATEQRLGQEPDA